MIKCVGKSLHIKTKIQMHLEDSNFLSTVTMLMESASPMDATQENTFGYFLLFLTSLIGNSPTNCPCTNIHKTAPQLPINDYFRDTGSAHHFQYIFNGDA